MRAPRVSTPAFRFVDLFAGIGGFHVAMAGLGGECVFASEIDPDCQAVYRRNFGMSPAGDIRPLTEGSTVEVPPHDVLCAGFPCQPFSKSGFQRGMAETRGTLFFNILRVLEECRPSHVLLENVRNLAGPRQRETWETIVRNLRALGYRVSDTPTVFSPHLLPKQSGGRPQVRERVFIPAVYVGEGATDADLCAEPLVENRAVGRWDPKRWRIEEWLQNEDMIPNRNRYLLRPEEVTWLNAWNEFLQGIEDDPLPGFPIWADAFTPTPRVTGDEPKWKRNFLEKNSAFYVANRRFIDRWLRRHKVSSFPASRRKFEWQARGWPRDIWKLVLHLRPSGIRVKGPTYLPALVAITQTSIIGSRRRRITPREAARLQGLHDSFTLHDDDKVTYRQMGNAVNVGAVRHVARRLLAEKAGAGLARRRRA